MEKKLYKFTAPLKITRNSKKTRSGVKNIYFNLNQYRNWNHHASHSYKDEYELKLYDQLRTYTFVEIEKITYKFYAHQKNVDLSNVCSIHDKFFCDAMTRFGVIQDDNISVIKKVEYEFIEVDKKNPRVEIYVKAIRKDDSKYQHWLSGT